MLGPSEKRKQVAEVAAQKEAQYEAYVRFEEITDQSERLARPMENGFIYQRDHEGKLSLEIEGRREYLEKVFREGYEHAQEMARYDLANWGFERERRGIELEELQEIQQLQDGETMIVFSPIPDAARQGQTTINGYDRKRQKMLVRIAERQGDETAIFSFSLDGSNYQAMQAAGQAVGAAIPDGLGSEDILRQRFHYEASDFSLSDFHSLIRTAYDMSMEQQFGGSFYAGRHDINKEDALTFIKAQPDLIDRHMQAVQSIMSKVMDKSQKDQFLEAARYDLAAALDSRMRGNRVDDLAEAGDVARAEGRDYNGDCPTGSASGQAEQLGYMQGKGEYKWMNCPYCGTSVFGEICTVVCTGCGATSKSGPTKKNAAKQRNNASLGFYGLLEDIVEENRLKKELAAAQEKQQQQVKKLDKSAYNLAG